MRRAITEKAEEMKVCDCVKTDLVESEAPQSDELFHMTCRVRKGYGAL